MSVVSYFLKIDGIEGESKDVKHKSELQIESWSFGAVAHRDPLGGKAKTSLSELQFTMRVDKASTKLFLHCSNGQPIATAVLSCNKAGGDNSGEQYLIVTLTEVYVASIQFLGSSDSDPTGWLQFSLACKTIKVEYKTQTQKGILSGAVGYTHTVGKGN